MDGGAWQAAIHGVATSQTWLRLHFHFPLSHIEEGNGNPLQCSCLENPRDGGAWWAAIYGVIQSWTQLKRLSSSSSIYGQRKGKEKERGEEVRKGQNKKHKWRSQVQETRCCQNKGCYWERGPQHPISKYEYGCILKQIFACKCLTFLRSEICWVKCETFSRALPEFPFLVCRATHCEISHCVCMC